MAGEVWPLPLLCPLPGVPCTRLCFIRGLLRGRPLVHLSARQSQGRPAPEPPPLAGGCLAADAAGAGIYPGAGYGLYRNLRSGAGLP